MRSDYPPQKRTLPPKRTLKSIIVLTYQDACASIKTWLNKTKGQINTMFTKNKTNTDAAATPAKKGAKNSNNKRNGILGLLMLLVVLSIAYSSYVVWFGTTGLAAKIMLAPQMIFAAAVLIWKFNK